MRLIPRSPWRTPWQADTLTGSLCATCARVCGPGFLRSRLIEPMLAGQPPFVLSDAFPGDLLPLPAIFRLARWPSNVDPKTIKRARWLSPDDFATARAGLLPPADRLLGDDSVLRTEITRHNTLSRDSDAALEEGGLFPRSDTFLRPGQNGDTHMSLYFRAADSAAADLLLDLLHELALTGFGADIATGRGQFDLIADPTPAPDLDIITHPTLLPHLDLPPPVADGVVVLSTFQPRHDDPTDGCWDAFSKFGKLGPDLGLTDVRKRTLVLLRPGASFRLVTQQPFLGQAIPMDRLLPSESADHLRQRGVEVIHPAFGLAIPISFPKKETIY